MSHQTCKDDRSSQPLWFCDWYYNIQYVQKHMPVFDWLADLELSEISLFTPTLPLHFAVPQKGQYVHKFSPENRWKDRTVMTYDMYQLKTFTIKPNNVSVYYKLLIYSLHITSASIGCNILKSRSGQLITFQLETCDRWIRKLYIITVIFFWNYILFSTYQINVFVCDQSLPFLESS